MMPLYNIVSAIIGIFTGMAILILIRNDRLSVNYSLWWGLLSVALIVFGLVPPLVDFIGARLGVHYPPILVVIIAICLIFVKLLFMDIHRSKHEQQIRILSQRLALYENDIKKNGPPSS